MADKTLTVNKSAVMEIYIKKYSSTFVYVIPFSYFCTIYRTESVIFLTLFGDNM